MIPQEPPSPRALLDANALWSPALRDTLLRAAENDLFQPMWSSEILEEMVRTILAKRSTVRAENLARTVARMQTTFPDATITSHGSLAPQLTNHPGDRHVLAAAIHGRAEIIVTWNRRHFLPLAEQHFGIAVITPDTFLCRLWTRNREVLHRVLIEQGLDLRPPHSLEAVLQSLGRSSLGTFVSLVRETTELA